MNSLVVQKTELESFDEFCKGWIGGKGGRPLQRNELFSTVNLKIQYTNLVNAVKCNYSRMAVTVKCSDCKNNMILYKSMKWRCVKYECYFKEEKYDYV